MNTSINNSAVLLLRVSSKEQGKSGLGIERQREDLTRFCQNNNLEVTQEFTEVESGTHRTLNDRPVLQDAIFAAMKSDSILLVATISRLSRDVQLISTLINAKKVRIVSAETGLDASHFEIYLRAVFAQEEANKISVRTKGALKAAKARGTKLGNPNLAAARKNAVKVVKQGADEFAAKVVPYIQILRDRGLSLEAIANSLNEMELKTRRDGNWYAATVSRYINRMAA